MFGGSLVAVVTPMFENGDIDFASLSQLVDWHIKSGTDGLVVLGTTGESATVEEDEREEIIKRVVKQVGEKIPVIVGTGANSTRHAIHLTQRAMELGADAALLVTPYYNKPTQEGLYQHYRAVAKAVPLPQILYNVPSRTACDLLPDTVLRLDELSNIVALKEATGDITRVKTLLDKGCHMDLLSGDDGTAMEFVLAGGKGVISVVANIAPKAVHDMCSAALQGNRAQAEQWNNKLAVLYKPLFVESNPIPAKWALKEMGMIEAGIRLPLTPLNEKYRGDLKEVMQQSDLSFF